jgi:hypothetical protein
MPYTLRLSAAVHWLPSSLRVRRTGIVVSQEKAVAVARRQQQINQ